MAPQPGTRLNQEETPAGLLSAFGRAVGFATLAGMAIAVLAGVVLLPAYAQLADARYQRDCLQAGIADAEALTQANEELIQDLPLDDVLNKRLARSQSQLIPKDEYVAVEKNATNPPPPLVSLEEYPKPLPPDNWALRAAERVQIPRIRRGLLLLSGMALLGAFFLFAPPHRKTAK